MANVITEDFVTIPINRWLRRCLSGSAFQTLLPILQNKIRPDRKTDFAKMLNALPPPPPTVLTPPHSYEPSDLEKLLLSLPVDESLIPVHLLRHLPPNRIDFIVRKMLYNQITGSVLAAFPICEPVQLRFCELLLAENTFLVAFSSLFSKFAVFSETVYHCFSRCLRKAFSNSIGVSHSGQFLGIVFASPLGSSGLAPFFSLFVDSPPLFGRYFRSVAIDQMLRSMPSRTDLPLSFLKFLVLASTSYRFSLDLIRTFLRECPILLFAYLMQVSSESGVYENWALILTEMRNAADFAAQISALVAFTSALSSSWDFFPLVAQNTDWILRLFLNHPSDLCLFAIVLYFAQADDGFAKSVGDTVDLKRVGQQLFRLRQPQEIAAAFRFVLLGKGSFPFAAEYLVGSHLISSPPSRSFLFSQSVLPWLLPSALLGLLETSEEEFNGLVRFILDQDSSPEFAKLYCAITDQKLLSALAGRGGIARDLLVRALAISCDFTVFHSIYSGLAKDIEAVLRFLTVLAQKTPLVAESVLWGAETCFPTPIQNSSIAIWVWGTPNLSKICHISDGRNPICFAMSSRRVSVSFNYKVLAQVPIDNSIENWTYLVINVSPIALTVFVNLAKFQVDIRTSGNVRLTILPGLEFQSLQILKPSLSFSQVMRLFALGPTHTGIIDHVLLLGQPMGFFVTRDFISSLYLGVSELYDGNDEYLNPFEVLIDLSIVPPYDGSQFEVRSRPGSSGPIFRKWSFVPFFDALAAHGGLHLVIHLFVEVLVKHPNLRSNAVQLLRSLLDRFPFVHQYFEAHSVYEMFAALKQDLPELFTGKQLTNGRLVKAFLRTPQTFQMEFSAPNLTFLNRANLFQSVILSISASTEMASESLMNFALNLTVPQNRSVHIRFVFDVIMVRHLTFAAVPE
jgi:hypothetical protein